MKQALIEAVPGQVETGPVELTILMPCLNEAETLARCIAKARAFLAESGILGEVLVADNGSHDGSQAIAATAGARVVPVLARGYGAALSSGIEAARGRFVIMGDADDSYDFTSLMPFVERLRAGAELVMGNRFRGGIGKGAMPFLHRYLGNPVLSFLGRLFFRIPVGDFHCGLRGFSRERVAALNLRTTGMEFASEMVVRAALAGLRIEEVPTRLAKDGRSRPPHLRTWSDGWRHLSFLLVYSPRWLFVHPGAALVAFGALAAFLLLPGSLAVGGIRFDIHTFIVACAALLTGTQALSFALVARRFTTAQRLLPPSRRFAGLIGAMTPDRMLAAGGLVAALGHGGLAWCVGVWASTGFGALDYASLLRVLVFSVTAIAAGLQLVFTGFLCAVVEIPTR